MLTPVFLDHLPQADDVVGHKPLQYKHQRNKALLDLLTDGTVNWSPRTACPGCGRDAADADVFSTTFIDFKRCDCNTIYAAMVPEQSVLDSKRLDQVPSRLKPDSEQPDFEFISLLNWISLTEAHLERRLSSMLDVRFCSQAPGWPRATEKLGSGRAWHFLAIEDETDPEIFASLGAHLRQYKPEAVLLASELDRVADPARLLRAIKDAAPKGTLVFIASSCADGLEYELLGSDSPSFVPLDRLTLFSIKGFTALAKAEGFEILEVSTPGRLDAVILNGYFSSSGISRTPFWSSFFQQADSDQLRDLQILLQRSLKSGIMRFVIEC